MTIRYTSTHPRYRYTPWGGGALPCLHRAGHTAELEALAAGDGGLNHLRSPVLHEGPGADVLADVLDAQDHRGDVAVLRELLQGGMAKGSEVDWVRIWAECCKSQERIWKKEKTPQKKAKHDERHGRFRGGGGGWKLGFRLLYSFLRNTTHPRAKARSSQAKGSSLLTPSVSLPQAHAMLDCDK